MSDPRHFGQPEPPATAPQQTRSERDFPFQFLGQDFKSLLPSLRRQTGTVRISVTRPYAASFGEGALRVLRARAVDDSLELLLGYERYLPLRPKPDRHSALKAER